MTEYNLARPLVMHIDLNSCFATVEQQSRPRLRGRPVAVVNRRAENATVITASYEAKACGVKTGMLLAEAQRLVKGSGQSLVVVESDPPKYRYVYRELLRIMRDYSASVVMLSIDEGVIDFAQATAEVQGRELESIGREIKQRLRDEVGVWMRCNVGIGNNRFLAKTAAGLHKPDGLDVLTSHNIREVFAGLELSDLTGIAGGNQRRLQAVGIFTPLQFLDASVDTLAMAFRSVHGQRWYRRLRGWEVDAVEHELKSIGRQYVLESRGLGRGEIERRLHILVDDVASKLRAQGRAARGISLYFRLYPHGAWQARRLCPLPLTGSARIWQVVQELYAGAPGNIRMISVVSDHLVASDSPQQLDMFDSSTLAESRLTEALDAVNSRYGAHSLHPASTLGIDRYVKSKVPFGSTRYL